MWRIWFRLRGAGLHPARVQELKHSLRNFDARVSVGDPWLDVHVRVAGHEGPASAIGDAAQMLRVQAANVGVEDCRILVVHAERIEASP